MLGPILCGLLTEAPLLPKLRGHFAEFLDNASPVGLGILSLSTCVGFRYGCLWRHSGFSRHELPVLPYFYFGPRRIPASDDGFSCHPLQMLAPVFPFPAHFLLMRPRSSDHKQYRNFHLLSIGYALQPRLRPRLTQGRSALPWKPWTSGLEDSHLHLATHSGILSPRHSTVPSGTASLRRRCSPTKKKFPSSSRASAVCFSPGHFRRRTPRPVSCYALFECMAASEPTSWLSSESHILFHLTRTWGP